MTKTEHARRAKLAATLAALGFTDTQADQLRRISMTLSRWYELECGDASGFIKRDPTTDRPYKVWDDGKKLRRYPVADREKGALKRLAAIMRTVNERRFVGDDASILQPHCDDLTAYIQTDPRGAALYILRPGDVPPGADPAAYYSRGICIY
jgi:hypothetical protein